MKLLAQTEKHSAELEPRGFTLLEVLVSIGLLGIISLLLVGMLTTASHQWIEGEELVDAYQNGQTALELITREMSGATIDTCQQFVVMEAETLKAKGAELVAPNSLSAMWMAPLGKEGAIRVVGYYVERDEERKFYRLKRLYVGPENEDYYPPSPYSQGIGNPDVWASNTGTGQLLDLLNGGAFDDSDPNNSKSVTGPVAEGVVGLWFQCLDLMGNPVPWVSEDENHPESALVYNSAAYFQMATTEPFDNGKSFVYFPKHDFAMKGNRLPAAVEITMVTVDLDTIDRVGEIPQMTNILSEEGVLDVDASLRRLQEQLDVAGVDNARTFTSRVKLAAGR